MIDLIKTIGYGWLTFAGIGTLLSLVFFAVMVWFFAKMARMMMTAISTEIKRDREHDERMDKFDDEIKKRREERRKKWREKMRSPFH
jgi:hypothetical protein